MHRRLDTNKTYFKEEVIWNLITSVISALAYLQENF